MIVCSVDGCNEPFHCKTFCKRHYVSFRKYGDPLTARQWTKPGEPLQWIIDRKDYDGDDCLKWPFQVTGKGYGQITFEGKRSHASRVMCIIANGKPEPDKPLAAHTCGNGHKGCVNPKHLVWKSHKDNVRDRFLHETTGYNIDFDETYKLDSVDKAFIKKHKDRILISELSRITTADPKDIYKVLDE